MAVQVVNFTIPVGDDTTKPRKLTFKLQSSPVIDSTDLVIGEEVCVACAADGTGTVSLHPGDYKLEIDGEPNTSTISVPTSGTPHRLESLTGAGTTYTNSDILSGGSDWPEQTSKPAAPDADKWKFYVKSDGNFYKQDENGTETAFAAGSGITTIQEEGSSLTQRTTVNFIGSAVTAADNSGSGRTDVTISAMTASSTDTLTNKTFDANGTGNSLSNVETADIASGSKSGSDTTLVTGTAGTNGDLAQWNVDGDLVDGPTPPSGTIVGTSDTQTLSGKTLSDHLTVAEIASPSTPATGYGAVYAKTDGKLYFKNDAGTESDLTASLPVDDTTALVRDPVDNTKLARIDAGAITTGTTRVITMGDRDVNLASGGTFAEASHNHAASEITSGTLTHERGGLEADVSAYSGLIKITGGATSAVTAPSGDVVGTTDTQTLTNKTLGATTLSGDLNAGSQDITALDNLQFDTSPTTPLTAEGSLYWDSTNKTVAMKNDESDVTMQIGQELYIRVRNETGATINNGEAVYQSGTETGGEERPLITEAQANSESTALVLGVATHSIENNTYGYVTPFGVVNDLDTSSFSAGDPLYLSADTAGALTNTAPTAPNFAELVGHVITSNALTGNILVQVVPDISTPAGDASELVVQARKGSAGTITAGQVVYQSGWHAGSGTMEVELADSDAAATMPAIGVARSSITNSTAGTVVLSGKLTGIDTSSFSVGDALYVSGTAGAFTSTRPTAATAEVQKIALCLRSNVSNGVIEIVGAGRSNDGPNKHSTAWFRISDSSDATKLIDWSASSITTGTTRTITMPDSNVNLGDMVTASSTTTFSNKTFSDHVTLAEIAAPSTPSAGFGAVYPKTDGKLYFKNDAGTETDLTQSGGGLSNVVEDATPQLGGQLDVNGNAIGDGTRELLTFTEDASAVNHVNIENQATGGGPIISAAGDDAVIDLVLSGKSTGDVSVSSELNMNNNNITNANDVAAGTFTATGDIDSSAGNISAATGDVTASTFTFSSPAGSASIVSTDASGIMGENFTPTGIDTALVSGTAGTSGNLVQWDANGDAVDSSVVAANVKTTRTGVYRTIWVGAAAMIPRTTNGAAAGTSELATNDIMLDSMDFDTTTEEGVGFWVNFGDQWDASTVKVKFYWTAASGSGTVKWDIAGQSYADSDAIDQALGTEQGVTDTLITANDMHISSATSALTIADATAGEPMYLQITRDVATDTLGVDAQLVGCMIQYQENSTEQSAW